MKRSWGLVALALAVAAGCVRLGIWQLDRLAQRRALNVVRLERRATPARDLTAPAVIALPAESVWEHRVIGRGVFDWTHEWAWPGRTVDGVPGVALLTLLRLPDGTGVFVDRGWVPSPDGFHVDLASTREADSAVVEGLALRAPRAPGDVDPATLADSVGMPLRPFVLLWLPDSGRFGRATIPVRRWPAPAIDDGPHLNYAIQWFAFAAIALGGAVAVLWTASRQGAAASQRVDV